MDKRMINIGFGNMVVAGRVLAVVNPKSSPMKTLRDQARSNNKLIDVTEGRRTRSLIIMDTGHIFLSSIQSDTLNQRFQPTLLADMEEAEK